MLKQFLNSLFFAPAHNSAKLANDTDGTKQKRVLPYTIKAVARTRQDIKNWNNAQNLTTAEEPKNYILQNLYTDALIDALLYSQVQNRLQKCMATPFVIKKENGDADEEQTKTCQQSPAIAAILQAIWECRLYGYSLVELALSPTAGLTVQNIPRQHVVPQKGLFYPDYAEDKTIPYRQLKEYGTWLLEFTSTDIGLINKAIPHVLFKRFAQSCWSELCELYGIPPRVIKTNTQDTAMLNRAEAMMRDMSAAAWFIIDSEETFEWAKATDTNGDVYKQLINLCNNEMSLLLTGAVIGQDTQNGSRSKDESGREQLQELVDSDLGMMQSLFNNTVMPALVAIGYLSGKPSLHFQKKPNLQQLWDITKESLPYYTVDADWVKDTFGVQITGERKQDAATGTKLLDGSYFFEQG
jgi:phage gp29-like protein